MMKCGLFNQSKIHKLFYVPSHASKVIISLLNLYYMLRARRKMWINKKTN